MPYQAQLLRENFELFKGSVPELKPDLIIYLRTDPLVCVDRITKRNRIEEMARLDLDYLRMLHEVHENWLNPAGRPPEQSNPKLIIIDANAPSNVMEIAYEKIMQTIEEELNKSILTGPQAIIENALQTTLLSPNAFVPQRATRNSIGFDLFSPITVRLLPSERVCIKLDINLAFPTGTYGRIAGRSGLALKGIDIGGGVIDPDFTGNIGVIMCNHSADEYNGTL